MVRRFLLTITVLTALSSLSAYAQGTYHTIYINANQDVDFTVQVGSKMYTKAETAIVPNPPIKAGRPGDPFKGWKLESTEPAQKYIVAFKPLEGFYMSSGGYVHEFNIPAHFDYFTYSTNIELYPTKLKIWATFDGAGFNEKIKAPFTITGPAMYSGEAGGIFEAWEKEKIPWGTYTFTWGDVPGYQTPKSEIFRILTEPEYDPPAPGGNLKSGILYRTIATGEKTIFTTYYKMGSKLPPPPPPKTYCDSTISIDTSQLKSGIHVGSNSSRATFYIQGQGASYNGEGNIWSKENTPSGTYTIVWGEVEGCNTPPTETKMLTIGGVMSFIGNYIPKDSKPRPAVKPKTSSPATPKTIEGTAKIEPKEEKSIEKLSLPPKTEELTPPAPPLTEQPKPQGISRRFINALKLFWRELFFSSSNGVQ